MSAPLPHATLKAKQRELRQGFPETMGLRVHRSISWIGRAEAAADDDARFIFQWIAFNAAYADEQEFQGPAPGERAAFADFFAKNGARLDAERRIYNEIWEGFAGPIRVLMQNKYVFNPFWQHHNGIEGYEDWEERFKASAGAFARSFAAQDTARTLSFVFDRLYVLRNQLVHGGATWNSAVNRDQVRDGASILGIPHARLRRRHDGQPPRGLGAPLLSRRGIERPLEWVPGAHSNRSSIFKAN